ncbi:hypothetical protein MF406_15465 [Georgenia sp. TF02-10]|uniref:DUF6788 family protein n=1 Tax=Georgenia sp. TF02-10 TaxID=2917725 RepID=UPI001FA6AFC9|nr:DUF6788 family protein [Georgenia sp. TF02-10]UNX54303.1 hypothetical protein MF406_15465 [Georgenia sp. TF02-10]
MGKDYSTMTVRQLEERKSLTLDRIAQVPQFRRGSLQVGYRRCGKPGCRCARPGEQGHGPRRLWTRTAKGSGGSRGQYIPIEQVDQVRAELDSYTQFAGLVEDYVEINEALCRARVGPPAGSRKRAAPAGPDGEKEALPPAGRAGGRRAGGGRRRGPERAGRPGRRGRRARGPEPGAFRGRPGRSGTAGVLEAIERAAQSSPVRGDHNHVLWPTAASPTPQT